MHGRNRVCGFFGGQRLGNRGCQNASPPKAFGSKFGIKSDSIAIAEGLSKAIRGPQPQSGCLRCRGLSLTTLCLEESLWIELRLRCSCLTSLG